MRVCNTDDQNAGKERAFSIAESCSESLLRRIVADVCDVAEGADTCDVAHMLKGQIRKNYIQCQSPKKYHIQEGCESTSERYYGVSVRSLPGLI